METPSSTRMVTRSQARAALSNSTHNIPFLKKGEESRPKTAKKDRSGLIDITNDSPIVGLAGKPALFEMETPLSSCVSKSTPGSGEALLRGQVKTLLQKVEEEAAQISRHGRFVGLGGFALAPTPANTPQISESAAAVVSAAALFTEYPIEDKLKISQVVEESISVDSDKSFITRSLLLDFSEKSDLDLDIDLEEAVKEKEEEEEDASIWSIQVNASTRDEDEDIENEEEDEFCEDEDYEDEEEEEEEEECEEVDELCDGMGKISVEDDDGVRFQGKHTRFVYNTKDEIEVKEEVVHLKGVPTPKGKHLRFEEEEEDEQ